MTCYYPKIRLFQKASIIKDGQIKDKTLRIISQNSPEFISYEYFEKTFPRGDIEAQKVPCGVCIGCRLKQAQEWAIRCELEAKEHETNYFITLTYNDTNLPIPEYKINYETGEKIENNGEWNGQLVKKDLQDFMKRLRNYYKYHNNFEGIRFFACGEYGGQTQRPHYHAILFNMPEIEDLVPIGRPDPDTHTQLYTSNTIEKVWGKGFIAIGEVNWDSISYVSRYCTKKKFGNIGKEIYLSKGQEPEFTQVSRRPGIAKNYYEAHKEEIYKNDEIINSKGKSIKPSSYFDKLYDIDNPKRLEEVKDARKKSAEKAQKIKSSKTTLPEREQLQIEAKTMAQKMDKWKRNKN